MLKPRLKNQLGSNTVYGFFFVKLFARNFGIFAAEITSLPSTQPFVHTMHLERILFFQFFHELPGLHCHFIF